jgi:hypothetical protein
LIVLCLLIAGPATASEFEQPDPLTRARTLYNQGRYEEAIQAATEARAIPAMAASASMVLGRARLERFRKGGGPADLVAAREALASADASVMSNRDRVELVIGYAQALYLEEAFGAAAEMFASVLERAADVSLAERERVLEWWAAAMDRFAQASDAAVRAELYRDVVECMEEELRRAPGSATASYWLASAARSLGDAERAWHAAIAGWVRAPLANQRRDALRADLDRLVLQAIIPERVKKLPPADRTPQSGEVMTEEWERIKARWSAR